MSDDDFELPDIQPDRAWAEHLGMPGLIAALSDAREENERLRSVIADCSGSCRVERLVEGGLAS